MKNLIILLSLIQIQVSFAAVSTKGIQTIRTVGSGPTCNYDISNGDTLQDALNSGVITITFEPLYFPSQTK